MSRLRLQNSPPVGPQGPQTGMARGHFVVNPFLQIFQVVPRRPSALLDDHAATAKKLRVIDLPD